MIYTSEDAPAIAASASDPSFSSVLLLVDATQSGGDVSANDRPINYSGTTGRKDKFYASGAGCIYVDDSADWNFTGNVTIEVFGVNFTDTTGAQIFINHYNAVAPFANNRSWLLQTDGTGNLLGAVNTAGTSGGNVLISGAWSPSTGTDYNLCLERSGSTWRTYVDGAVIASNTLSGTLFDSSDVLTIGAGRSGSSMTAFLKGTFKAARITTLARYSGAYTPPSLPLPRQ